MKPKIKCFGFEIEAEMSTRLMNSLVEKNLGLITGDGSIRPCVRTTKHSLLHPISAKEFVSKVMSYDDKGKRDARIIFDTIREHYAKKEFHWNHTMGFHVHLSFTPKMPVDCWSAEFAKFFAERMEKKFPRVYQERSTNSYCKVSLDERDIALGTERYRFINFAPAYHEHGTIEFRVFPSDDPDHLRLYLYFTMRTVEEFIRDSEKYLKRSFELELENDGEIKEEIIEKKIRKRALRREVNDSISDNVRNEVEIHEDESTGFIDSSGRYYSNTVNMRTGSVTSFGGYFNGADFNGTGTN
jgi:hypothetical protein